MQNAYRALERADRLWCLFHWRHDDELRERALRVQRAIVRRLIASGRYVAP